MKLFHDFAIGFPPVMTVMTMISLTFHDGRKARTRSSPNSRCVLAAFT